MTTKEEFIVNAQVYFYYVECHNEETFLIMDNNVKDASIMHSLDEYNILDKWEFNYLVENNEKLLIRYFEELIAGGDELDETECNTLTFTQMGIWFNMLHKSYIEDGEEQVWENHWIVSFYATLRATHRDNQINSILND
jgi:hypothetical protein